MGGERLVHRREIGPRKPVTLKSNWIALKRNEITLKRKVANAKEIICLCLSVTKLSLKR